MPRAAHRDHPPAAAGPASGRAAARPAAGQDWQPFALFGGCVLLISVVTALLNLDTAVAFLTPVLVYTARSRGGGEAPLLYGCLLLANAGSILLPGSNLTNLIVLGHLHLSGALFASRMCLAWLAAIVVTAATVAFAGRGELRGPASDGPASAGSHARHHRRAGSARPGRAVRDRGRVRCRAVLYHRMGRSLP